GAFPSSSRRGGAKRRGGGVQRRRTSCPRHRRVLPSFTGGQRPEHSPPRRGGVARSDGVVGFNAAGPPVRDTVASCPPSQEGKDRSIPLLVEEGWREATGWWGSTPQDHLSATQSRPALLHRRAKTGAFPSSSRRGGAKRRGGGVQRRRTTCPRHCRVLPSFTGGQRPEHSPPHRGGGARSDGVVGFNAAGPPVRDTVASRHPCQEGKDRSIPLLVEEGWREATGWSNFKTIPSRSAGLVRPGRQRACR